jgi:hypothetical protein
MRRPEVLGFACDVETEFRKIGFTKNAEAGLFESGCQFIVVGLWWRVGKGTAGTAGSLSGNPGAYVL